MKLTLKLLQEPILTLELRQRVYHIYAATVNFPNELARDRISIFQPGQKIVIADSNPKFLQENLRIRLGLEDELLGSGENGNQLNRWNLLKKKMVEAARIAWAAILIKARQLILFDGAGFETFVACAKRR